MGYIIEKLIALVNQDFDKNFTVKEFVRFEAHPLRGRGKSYQCSDSKGEEAYYLKHLQFYIVIKPLSNTPSKRSSP